MRVGQMLKALGCAAVLCGLAAGTAAADDWSKKYAVSGKPELRVESNDAHIDVDAWDRKEIEARVNTRGWSIGATGVRITESQTGNQVSVSVRVPRMEWHFGMQNRSVSITLLVPRDIDLTAETGDGHVRVNSLTGKIDVHTGDGHITFTAVRGMMRLRTGDGHVTGESLDGSLNVETGDGRVRVDGRFDALDLRTNDGSIEADVRTGSKIQSAWYVTTGDGAVRLRIPANFSADLDANTGDGSIRVDFPLMVPAGRARESSVSGKLNGGGPPLRVRTGDGSITISGS
ncbi:MAG: DUF4097 domain-containing protein [Acidobacteria bacterium]|nr:DUF4097 domain-containing protein [Acidobacteriota bacterium]